MRSPRSLAATVLIVLGGVAALAPSASATTATATLTAGSLGFINSTPAAIAFSGTLNGADQVLSSPQPFDISDATGSAAGWNVTATSTTFTAGSKTLATGSTTITATPTIACDSGSSCTPATDGIAYPYTLPAATTAPTATKVFNATAGTGMGNQTVTPAWKLAIPGSTVAGTYTSTWTLSLVSGP